MQSDATLRQFVEITHLDVDQATQVLQSCNWDLETAVGLHLAGTEGDTDYGRGGRDTTTPSSGGGVGVSSPSGGAAGAGRPVPRAFGRGQEGGGGGGDDPEGDADGEGGDGQRRPLLRTDSVASTSSTSSLSRISSAVGLLGRAVLGVARTVAWVGSGILSFFSAVVLGPPGVPSESFDEFFEARYGRPRPDFFRGGLREALATARREEKVIFVYCHSDASAQTERFCRDVLKHDAVVALLNENFLVIGLDTSRLEGARTLSALRGRRCPFVALVMPPMGSSMEGSQTLHRLEGQIGVDQLVAVLTVAVGDMESLRHQVRVQSEETQRSRLLREEQDAEYLEALERDRQMQMARDNEEAERRAEEARKREAERERDRRRAEKEDKKRRLEESRAARSVEVRRILEEDDRRISSGESAAKILIRLPTGGRFERKFRADAPLSLLFDWIECRHLIEGGGGAWVAPGSFELKQTFPLRAFQKSESTLSELQLAPSSALLLHPLEAEDDAESEAAS
uniref:UBX domain-containing protein n=1 Tax=Chromera velia CCMP2878 TaxID=1169474 RepID=A0A0G4HII2_9ALVE|eukprot:Cvel_27961.t1-p1 / transcript=Cvel_27961.t1 / gene=Cvel_27961 / organism=Chromera_velia_CCMP2878 / gene_product=FAS-associated factor 2, putative / transcript_product=FAS-associated factor 2, putative / location=Cvel_scaffold3570:8727-14371(-) / protein_length=511 / sequence_SO=supercontig / SO=protein_coding / is_pseudo=false